MLIKVCGLNHTHNFDAISKLEIDMVGLNFYAASKRYVDHDNLALTNKIRESKITKVGVFVNHNIQVLQQCKEKYGLEYVQLHGNEDIEFCKQAKEMGKVIKVFGIDSDFDFEKVMAFDFCDLFLFDTKDVQHGGSGRKFKWDKLEEYKGKMPFLLAGGIGPDDARDILQIQHPALIGVDINSRFEDEPGIKNIKKVTQFSDMIKSEINKVNVNRI